VLISRRHDHLHQGGLWEFPGGKVEQGEEGFSALRRELKEELSIEPISAHPLIRIPYCYPDRKVLLDVWRVTKFKGKPQGVEGQPVSWVTKDSMTQYAVPAANGPIIRAASLPSSYLITPSPGDRDNWPGFLGALQASLESGVLLVQLRCPDLVAADYLDLAQLVSACCRRYGAKLLLNAAPSLLEQCDAAGIHLNSKRLMQHSQRPIADDKLLAASCHNLDELQYAEQLGVDFAVLSPVKVTASHPGVGAIGWSRFQWLSEQTALPVYALGGMTHEDLTSAWHYGGQGIAAIRALWQG
jgi:8-oxo-dGTP diphosphatase